MDDMGLEPARRARFRNLRRPARRASIGLDQPDQITLAMTAVTTELDTSGLNCPLPILKAKKALAGLTGGQLLRVIATDPEAVRDFTVFSQQMGHTLLESREENGRFYFLLQKRES